MLLNLSLAGLWGGLLSVERRAFLQAMFSRPLVAATGTGLLLQDPESGLYVGLVFELYYLGAASLGGAHSDHETLPSITAAALASCIAESARGPSTPAIWSLSILVCAPLGPIGRALENRIDARAVRYLGAALTSADAENFRRVARQNLWAMWPHFVVFGTLCAGAAALGNSVETFERALPLPLLRGLAWAYPAMASVAAGLAVRGSRTKKAALLAASAAGVTLVVLALTGRFP
ncbi:MAG: PTS sugar transporter subunit IIC [Archangiaceae bacterium]|nr:PTS sugar transporter subunit IIC [Archangiaceae bacterium]